MSPQQDDPRDASREEPSGDQLPFLIVLSERFADQYFHRLQSGLVRQIERADLAQEAILRVLEYLASAQGRAIDNPDAFVTCVVYGCAVSAMRRGGARLKEVELTDQEDEQHPRCDRSPSDECSEREQTVLLHERVTSAIATLSEKQRAVLKLRMGGRTHVAIGRELGITESASRAVQHRALNGLKRQFDRIAGE